MADDAPQMTEEAKAALARAKAGPAPASTVASPAIATPAAQSGGPSVTVVDVVPMKPEDKGGKLTVTSY